MEYTTLYNGVKKPMISFGVLLIPEEVFEQCIFTALEAGYRAFDTAQAYGNEHLLGISYVFLTLRYLLDALPYLLDILIVFAVQDLIRAEQNSERAVCAANKLSKYCGVSLILIVVSTTIYHILQLLFLKQIHQSSVTVELPLFSLLFVLAVLWMAQYVKENKKLKDDNDLFI